MRRVIAGVVILLFASFAQGGFVFTVNGEPQPDLLEVLPWEVPELDLELGAGQNIMSYNLDYILSNDNGRFITDGASGSYPGLPPMTDIEFLAGFDILGKVTINEPQHVRIAASQIFSPPLEGPQILMVELYVHIWDSSQDVILEIISQGLEIDGEYIEPGTLMHTLTIRKIPEPMTIALLGLGGLFVLRGKKE